jgi:hypothetical protein
MCRRAIKSVSECYNFRHQVLIMYCNSTESEREPQTPQDPPIPDRVLDT